MNKFIPTVKILTNGLTVIVQPVPYAPVAAAVIAYRAGSLWETDRTRGLSHFCEHMMFRGTSLVSGTRFWQTIQRDGGVSNAFTSRDMTAYYAVVPNGRLDDILRIEADRITGLLLDPDTIDTEKMVILEERKMTRIDNPSGALSEMLHRTAFSMHPYRNPVIGYDEDIQQFSRDGTEAFYRNFYTPSNCVVVLTGRIETEQTVDLVERYFGSIAGASTKTESILQDPVQTSERSVEFEHNSTIERLVLSFQGTNAGDPRNPILDMITMNLAGGRSGRLEELLVQSEMATEVFASNDNNRDRGLLTLGIGLNTGVSWKTALDAIRKEVRSLKDTLLSQEDIDCLKARFRAMRALTSSSPAGRALELAMGWCICDDPLYSVRAEEIVRSATPEDVMQAATAILLEERSTIVRLVPARTDGSGIEVPTHVGRFVPDVTPPQQINFDGLEISDELLTIPPHSISAGAIEETFDNGLKILLKPDHSFPLLTISFSVPMGSGMEPPEKAGLSAVTIEAMHYGTEDSNYMEFNRRIEARGTELSFSAGSERSSGNMTMLSSDALSGIEILSDLLLRPAFRALDVDMVLREAAVEVGMRTDSVFAVSMDNLARIMTVPEEAARIPSIEKLSRIRREDIRSFHHTCVRPLGSVIVVVGDFSPETILSELRQRFSGWINPPEPLPILDQGSDSLAPETLLTPLKGKAQTAVIAGYPAPHRDSEDRTAFHLLNAILGDGICSRLGRKLRDSDGLAYSVGSEYFTGRNRGRFLAYISTSPEHAWKALNAMRREIDILLENPAEPLELRLAKASSIGRHALGLMHYYNVADYLLLVASTGKPLDQDLISLRKIVETGRDELREVARRWLGDREPFVSIAGDLEG